MAKPYRVLCISMYESDIAALDALVARMKAAGWRKANRSHLIRLALAHLDEDSIQAILDVHATEPELEDDREPDEDGRKPDTGRDL